MNKLFLGIMSALGIFAASEASSLAAPVCGAGMTGTMGPVGPVGCNYCEDGLCGGDPGCIDMYCRHKGFTTLLPYTAIFVPGDMSRQFTPDRGGCGHFGDFACSLTHGPFDLSHLFMALIGPSTLRVIFHEEAPELVESGALRIAEAIVLDGETADALGAQGTIPAQIAPLQADEEGKLRIVDLDIRLGDGDAPPGVSGLAVIAKSTPMSHGTFIDNHGSVRKVIAAEARLLAPLDLTGAGAAAPPSAPVPSDGNGAPASLTMSNAPGAASPVLAGDAVDVGPVAPIADVGGAPPMAIEYVLYLDDKTPCTFLYGVEGDTLHKLASPGTSLTPGAMVSLSQSKEGIIAGSGEWPSEMDACWTAFESQFNTKTFDRHFGEAGANMEAAFPWKPLWELAKLLFAPTPAGICSTTWCGTGMDGQYHGCSHSCCPAACRND